MNEAIETETTSDYDEFLEHMEAAGADLHHTQEGSDGNIGVWICCYAGRDNVIAGTWDRERKIGTLDLL